MSCCTNFWSILQNVKCHLSCCSILVCRKKRQFQLSHAADFQKFTVDWSYHFLFVQIVPQARILYYIFNIINNSRTKYQLSLHTSLKPFGSLKRSVKTIVFMTAFCVVGRCYRSGGVGKLLSFYPWYMSIW